MGFHFFVGKSTINNFYLKTLSISLLKLELTTLFFILFISLVIGDNHKSNFQLTEENTRFAFRRCQNISNTSTELISLWNEWKFPNNKITHCYVKCFLYKLGLINLTHMGLDEQKFNSILKINEPLLDESLTSDSISYEKQEILDIFQPLDSTCQSYYKAWILLLEKFGSVNIQNRFQNDNISKSKAVGQKASEFCNENWLKYVEITWNSTLHIINSNNCRKNCIYQYFHYIDVYERVDVQEILQSYLEANQSSQLLGNKNSDSSYKLSIEKCAHYANQLYYQGLCFVTTKLHKCLMETVIGYNKIFKFRDETTFYY